MSNKDQQRLVLFDFDGTLTRHDSLFSFLRFLKGNFYFAIKIVLSLPSLIGFKIGLIDNSRAKEKLLINFLKGMSEIEFSAICTKFCQDVIPYLLDKKIVKKFHQHISNGDRVIIVSASLEDWILPWAQQWNVEVLATKSASVHGVLTGKFEGNNCNYEEKVARIKAHLDISKYNTIWAYGDSSGDEEMLRLATCVVYRGEVRIRETSSIKINA